jgi:glycosyltransferase involved in cell wall biosynthesis
MVLFIGQKLTYKGFDTLIEAAPYVWDKHPETSFVFIGPHYPGSKEIINRLDDPRGIGRTRRLSSVGRVSRFSVYPSNL